ncbi:recombination protein RecR [Candidatus Kaiserbacteria bacterium]|nr:recombination protein RecR [Candidatus Kaiserbacteria bacterium]
MDAIERLTSLFEKFPGIGPRQAQRFVQFLLRASPSLRRELIDSTRSLGTNVRQCPECMRYHSAKTKVCSICSDTQRDTQHLAIVASNADLTALEKSGTYKGSYFVLGGTISLASEKTNGLRIKQLLDSLPSRTKNGLKEVILAFPANPEGDATAVRLREEISPFKLTVTSLGRGLSTGSELEYADAETLKSALESRR